MTHSFSGREVGRSKEDEIMRKGKVKGQSQTILGFVESCYEKVITKRMCEIFSTKREKVGPHDLVGFIDTAFDQSGECIKFSLSEIHPAKKKAM